ncbi:MAG: SseB family protein [Saccharofermentans sp.]|nr:SseB family protein [Saccharofermentans sp.]
MKTLDEELNQMYIKEAVQEYLKSDEPEDMFLLIAQIVARIHDDGTVPVPMMNSTSVVWGVPPDAELEDVFPSDEGPGRRSCLIDYEGEKWFPLFTDVEELGGLEDTNVVEDIPIKTVIELAFSEEDISGIVINPNSEAFAMRKELLYVILNLLKNEDSEA